MDKGIFDSYLDSYYAKFDQINYAGCSGFGMRVIWNKMESIHAGGHFPRVLELGATNLQHLKFVGHTFDEYIATDIRALKIDELNKANIPNKVKFELQDATRILYPDNSFDRTLTTCLFHHIAKPEIAMQEMLRVTKPGGVISFSLPCDPGLMLRALRRITTRRRAIQLFRKSELPDPRLIWALEHRNHISGIQILLSEVFKNHKVLKRGFPISTRAWNVGIWEFYDVKKLT